MHKNVGNCVLTVRQTFDWIWMRRLVSKAALRSTIPQTLSIFHQALLKKNGCFFCRDTAYGFPLSSSRMFFLFNLLFNAFFVPIHFSFSKRVQTRNFKQSMFLNCVLDSLLWFKEHVNDTDINYIKLNVFSKCAEKILGIDTQHLKVSSWGWLKDLNYGDFCCKAEIQNF